ASGIRERARALWNEAGAARTAGACGSDRRYCQPGHLRGYSCFGKVTDGRSHARRTRAGQVRRLICFLRRSNSATSLLAIRENPSELEIQPFPTIVPCTEIALPPR